MQPPFSPQPQSDSTVPWRGQKSPIVRQCGVGNDLGVCHGRGKPDIKTFTNYICLSVLKMTFGWHPKSISYSPKCKNRLKSVLESLSCRCCFLGTWELHWNESVKGDETTIQHPSNWNLLFLVIISCNGSQRATQLVLCTRYMFHKQQQILFLNGGPLE